MLLKSNFHLQNHKVFISKELERAFLQFDIIGSKTRVTGVLVQKVKDNEMSVGWAAREVNSKVLDS
jgi:hypothetical protein